MGQLTPGGNIPGLNIAGVLWPAKYSGLKVLVGITNGGAYSSLREPGTTTDYVVPAGKTFKGVMMKVMEHGAVVCGYGVGYSTGAPTWAGGAAPGTPIQYVGGAATFLRMGVVASLATVDVPLVGWSVPTGKYPFVTEDAGGICSFIVYGYEE